MSLPDPFDSEPVPQERLSRRTIISWLVVVGLAILFLPIYLIYTGIRGEAARLQAELEPIQLMLTNVGTPVPEVLELVSTLTHVHESVSQVQAVYPTLAAAHADWPAIAAAIARYDSSQLAVIGLSHVERQITLTGRAADDDAVIAYARSLEASGLFARVVVQSIKTVATPYATPTSTAVFQVTVLPTPTIVSPPTATYTATPDSRDGYEPDDITPADIFIGQAQQHNFEPVYDVDRVQFLVKAGRYYKVSTLGLAPGVDTLLVVGLGGAVYTNDDRQPGDLSSEVSLRGGSTDLGAVVEIRNRGHYGADKSYQVMVQEVIPTSTPAPTSTSIPTWTPIPTATPTQPPTSTPTLTVTPSPTPTATPDLRDAYEPDEGQPKPIAVGETQIRSFYPQDDLDIGTFLVKAGRFYRVYTWNLAVGVDTRLTVLVGQTEYVNDDRAPGDLSSEISFEVPATNDIVALFFAANRGQYGPDKHYQITVEEYVPTVTPTPEVTATVTPTETVQPASYVRPFGRGLVPLALVSNQEVGSVEFVIVLDLWDAAP